MSKAIKNIIVIGLLAPVLVIQSVEIACADECADLKAQAKKERSILKQIALYKSAVLVCPDDSELIYSYAYSLERMGKDKEALLEYQRVIELDSSYAKAFFNMGDIYRSLGEKYEAIKSYQQGLEISPDDARVEKRLRELLTKTSAK